MGTTSIEWTATVDPDGTVRPGKVWNPVSGCSVVSTGCTNCYAQAIWKRFDRPQPGGYRPWTAQNATHNVRLHPERLADPFSWRKPARVFVNSVSDLFHEQVPDSLLNRVFAVMAATPWHAYQVLTKRPERMRAYLTMPDRDEAVGWAASSLYEEWSEQAEAAYKRTVPAIGNAITLIHQQGYQDGRRSPVPEPPQPRWPLPNVWLGVSVEDQRRADERIPLLLQTPAAVRFLSCEPLLKPVELWQYLRPRVETIFPISAFGEARVINWPGISWVIAGSESGPGARPAQVDWFRSLRDQCQAVGVPYFLKQFATPAGRKIPLPELDGRVWAEYPAVDQHLEAVAHA